MVEEEEREWHGIQAFRGRLQRAFIRRRLGRLPFFGRDSGGQYDAVLDLAVECGAGWSSRGGVGGLGAGPAEGGTLQEGRRVLQFSPGRPKTWPRGGAKALRAAFARALRDGAPGAPAGSALPKADTGGDGEEQPGSAGSSLMAPNEVFLTEAVARCFPSASSFARHGFALLEEGFPGGCAPCLRGCGGAPERGGSRRTSLFCWRV